MTVRELSGRPLWALMLVILALQIWFATEFRGLRAAIDEMPPPPTERALKAMALGDDEFLFRHLARWLEFVGDGGGRVRPLRFYDYDRAVGWMQALDQLDAGRSDFVHVIATRYFGEITKAVDADHRRLRTIIEYLRTVSLHDPVRYWNWMVWSAVKARTDVKDPRLVAAIAHDLQSPELRDPRVPAWVRVLPVRLYRFAGDEVAARDAEAHITPQDASEIQAMKDRLRDAARKLGNPAVVAPRSSPPDDVPSAPTQSRP